MKAVTPTAIVECSNLCYFVAGEQLQAAAATQHSVTISTVRYTDVIDRYTTAILTILNC